MTELINKLSRLHDIIPQYFGEVISHLFFQQLGLNNTATIAVLDLHKAVNKESLYGITKNGLVDFKTLSEDLKIIHLGKRTINSNILERYVDIKAIWQDSISYCGTKNNIIGENGRLILEMN